MSSTACSASRGSQPSLHVSACQYASRVCPALSMCPPGPLAAPRPHSAAPLHPSPRADAPHIGVNRKVLAPQRQQHDAGHALAAQACSGRRGGGCRPAAGRRWQRQGRATCPRTPPASPSMPMRCARISSSGTSRSHSSDSSSSSLGIGAVAAAAASLASFEGLSIAASEEQRQQQHRSAPADAAAAAPLASPSSSSLSTAPTTSLTRLCAVPEDASAHAGTENDGGGGGANVFVAGSTRGVAPREVGIIGGVGGGAVSQSRPSPTSVVSAAAGGGGGGNAASMATSTSIG